MSEAFSHELILHYINLLTFFSCRLRFKSFYIFPSDCFFKLSDKLFKARSHEYLDNGLSSLFQKLFVERKCGTKEFYASHSVYIFETNSIWSHIRDDSIKFLHSMFCNQSSYRFCILNILHVSMNAGDLNSRWLDIKTYNDRLVDIILFHMLLCILHS